MKTKDKKEDRKIVWKSSMPWNQADYKAQLQKDLKDIRQKLSRVLGKDLAKKEPSNVEATSPVNCIEGGVLVDLCMKRSRVRGSGCDAPAEIYEFPTSADRSCKAAEGFPTPVTSPLLPPKPPRTKIKQYAWRNSAKKEVCMYIRILKPLEIRKEKEELTFKSQELTNFSIHQEAQPRHLDATKHDVMDSGVIIASPNGDVTTRVPDVNRLIARKRYVPRKRSLTYSIGSFERLMRACIRIITFIVLFVAITTNVLGGLINTRQYERKSTVGNSASLPLFKCSMSISCYSFLSILRKFSANILSIDKELWPYVIIEANWKDNKRLKRRREVLHNTRIRKENSWYENIFRPVTAPPGLRNLRSANVRQNIFFWRENV